MNLFHKKTTFSLRAKLVLLIEAFVIVLVITIGIITTVREKDTLVNELHKRGFALASDLSRFVARPLINQDLADLRRFIIYSMKQDYVEHITILDKHNNVVMHNDLTKVGEPYEFLTEGENICSETCTGKIEHPPKQNVQHCDIFVPIKISDVKLGTIVLGYSHQAVAKEIAEAQNQIILFVAAAIIIGAIFSYILATLISSPIKKITEATEKLANGNLDVPLNIKRNDEIGILAGSFNKMAGDLQTHRTHLERLVEERTADLKVAIKKLEKEIVERKFAENALRESELTYRNLFENSLDAIYITSREGKFIDVNQSGLDLFDYKREEMTGMDISKVYLNLDDRERFQQDIERRGSVRNCQVKLRKKDGKVMDCLICSTVRYTDDGDIMGYQGIIRDVTQQKLLEAQLQQAQKMEAVGTLAGGISHDFNNLLQGIVGYAQIIMMDKDPKDPDYHSLKEIYKAAQRAGELTKQLLTFSRKMESELKPVNLNHEVEQVCKLLSRAIPKMIDIKLHLTEGLNIINADPIQLEQILMNLGVNAKDAMPDGGKLVFETKNVILDEEYCKIHLELTPGEYVLLSVRDTGHGIDKETMEHIFEPFYTTKETGKGTGLGLAMVYGIVKNHGGYIDCYSELGKGAVFSIYFPVLVEEDFEQEEDVIDDEKYMGFNESILLVDDEEIIIDQEVMLLNKLGYKIITANNGEKAIELYKTGKDNIDLIILDVSMPGMGGHKCLEELVNINSEVKVIIRSGYAVSGKIRKSLESGTFEFISKPYRIMDMAKKIRKVLDQK